MAYSSKLLEEYFASVNDKFQTGQAREHAYRPVFERLIHELDASLKILNDPSRSAHGNPDFVFLRGDVTVGYTETKDIGVDLDKVEKSDQMQRYLGYSNLILTDYLEFRFFRNGVVYEDPIRIAHIQNGHLVSNTEQFERLLNALSDFLHGEAEPIKDGKHLAEIMGGKARRLSDNVLSILNRDKVTDVQKVFETMRNLLVHDMSKESFADMYAQTLVYGLFVARYSDETPETFSRSEARDLVPASNPFLAHFFDHIAGVNFEPKLGYIVDELCEVFRHADVKDLMTQYFGKTLWGDETEGPDPVIHFYEDFLKEYDPELRKKMGAYYTPTPVVRFIVKSVDKILEKDFGLARGLADTSKHENGIHKVQVLDPATGTGTFISAVIRTIYERILKSKQEGSWPAYVHHDLLPRIHAFELMMGPYTIAHLKLSMAFKKTGFWNFHRRLNIFLTNSLEETAPQDSVFSGFGFAESIAEESKEASKIKNDTPIMVIIGNPPYSPSSSNKGKWIQDLVKVYKNGLEEKSYNALSDDYVKFLRLAEHFIEKNESGIIAMITNNSFVDGIVHRQMRKHLLETFDDIYIYNLHGDSNKKEKSPDGSKDENVFEIQQGVAISILVKKSGGSKNLANVWHADLYGTQKSKYSKLTNSNIENTEWKKLDSKDPYFFFVPKNFELEEEYNQNFSIEDLFLVKAAGIKTHRDAVVIGFSKEELRLQVLAHGVDPIDYDEELVERILYRPFDVRFIYYDTKLVERHRKEQMKHSLKNNINLLSGRQSKSGFTNHYFVSDTLSEMKTAESSTGSYHFPLYVYDDHGEGMNNFEPEIYRKIESVVGDTDAEKLFGYIYATLYSHTYRDNYGEFLKINFPSIPFPSNAKSYQSLSQLGVELQKIHLMESTKLYNFVTSYSVSGENLVEKISYKNSNVYINSEQCFGDVPEVAWNFYIGGYQPAQKWLKDRKDRKLTHEDVEHYQKIIVALIETDRIMKEIDSVYKI